jgi:hypothetical protein
LNNKKKITESTNEIYQDDEQITKRTLQMVCSIQKYSHASFEVTAKLEFKTWLEKISRTKDPYMHVL